MLIERMEIITLCVVVHGEVGDVVILCVDFVLLHGVTLWRDIEGVDVY